MDGAQGSFLGENWLVMLVSLVVVLALVFGFVWAMRRYGRTRRSAESAARGRLPRLAVVDALSVDSRRQLLLVRRDNVEHLILVGGPSDIVVEPSILRTRAAQRPATVPTGRGQAPAVANAPQPAPPPPPERPASAGATRATSIRAPRAQPSGADDPIPFAPRRPAPRQLAHEPQPARAAPAPLTDDEAEARPGPAIRPPARGRPAVQLPKAEPPRSMTPAEPEPVPVRAPAGRHPDSPFAPPEKPAHPPHPFDNGGGRDDDDTAPGMASALAPPGEEPRRPPPMELPASDDDDANTVSDLEEDMARLLGQISPRR